jgi:hypothetical protein
VPAIGDRDEALTIAVRARRAEIDRSSPDEVWTRDLLAWVELVVRARLSEQPHEPASGGRHILCWTAGLEQIRALIGADPARAPPRFVPRCRCSNSGSRTGKCLSSAMLCRSVS